MKTKSITLLMLLPIVWLSSCTKEDICDGMGTLELTNDSHSTVQRIMIDGVNYGTLDPNESKEIKLSPGQHEWQLVGISGGSGCSAATVIIVECQTLGFSCGG